MCYVQASRILQDLHPSGFWERIGSFPTRQVRQCFQKGDKEALSLLSPPPNCLVIRPLPFSSCPGTDDWAPSHQSV